MFNLGDQLNGSFEELMHEIRAMRRELERIRKALEAKPVSTLATRTPRTTAKRPHAKVA